MRGTGLSHRFGSNPELFADLDLELRPGQIVGLCGPSGSGKSTLLSIVAGWEQPTGGRVERVDVDRTCWVFQNPHGVARRTAIDHVVLPLLARRHSRAEAEERALAVMSLFGLVAVAGRPFRDLSGGEAQRLMLARAVATAPDLLLVDEPTAQLDQRTAATVNQTLANVAQENTIVVIATHDPATRAACTHVVDLSAGARSHAEARR
ncbi:ATP-binding cassette domain-containing protein [Cellulomonas cellasea]|uniref:ABC-type lipoprotein export system ATPase subunit n=1 Tax=Cellulomonas cellasea TaxID=43670 RepID=A0A7W4UGG0_9CELL|nr:ATP-binding cassette domain-containing protein [Cellulomonas cellasea]MBB2923731.1 ABC-type lipoprotein export system ATPase subunit [Cellulomonas cellasea]